MFEKLALYLGQARTREGLIAVLDKVEMSEEDERMAVATTQHFGHFVRETLTALFELGIKQLPPAPSGRRRKLTPELAAKINAYVLHLFGSNVDLRDCKTRAAQKFGVSYSTVQRAWSNRGKAQPTEVDATEFVEFIRKKLSDTWIVHNGSIVEAAKSEYKAIAEQSAS